MERLFSDIFPPFVFNNIMEDTFIFSPRVFGAQSPSQAINLFNFSNLTFFTNLGEYR